MKNNRAYSLFEIKAIDDEKRTIEGIATTVSPDRMDDVVEPLGGEYKLPIPFLFQHNSRQPMGKVIEAKASKTQIAVKIQVAAAGVAQFIDEAFALIKAGLVPGLSIGFRSLEESYDRETGGYHFLRWEWMELSAVTIPANSDCTIMAVKSADSAARAALGSTRIRAIQLGENKSSGVTENKRAKNMTLKEQIAQLEAKRAASEARMDALLAKSADAGTTMDAAETEEYDNIDEEIKNIDEHLTRLKAHEARVVARAKAVPAGTTDTVDRAAQSRRPNAQITLERNLPKGIGFARMAICMIKAGPKNSFHAMALAKQHYSDTPEVELMIKTAIEAGDTSTSGWASQLLPAAQQMSGEFLDMLRPLTLMGKMDGRLRKVPFNVSVPLQSGGGTYGYVGEGAAKPVGKMTLGSATLRFEKAAGIIVITQELAKFGSPSAELLVRDEMLKGLAVFFDTVFVSQAAAVSNVQPAGILNGIAQTIASGTSAARFRYDMNILLQNFITNNQDPTNAVILMSSGMTMALASMINSLGQKEFPGIVLNGGDYNGIPIFASQTVGSRIVLVNAADILLAEDPAMTIDVSTEASVEMDTEPVQGESSPASQLSQLKSFWQNNLVGLRIEQFRTWKVARTSAVEWINNALYTPPTS